MTRTILTLALLIVNTTLLQAAEPAQDVRPLVAKLPADTVAGGQAIAADLIKAGPGGLRQIIDMLEKPGSPEDAKARFALMAVAFHVGRPDAESERSLFARTLIDALGGNPPSETRRFVIYLLQLTGREEAVAPIARQLADEAFIEPAAAALVQIRTPSAVAALVAALPGAKENARATIFRALGDMRAREAVTALSAYSTSRAALDALANIGDPASADLLVNSTKTGTHLEKAHAAAMCLRYAERLAAADADRASRICRTLLADARDAKNNPAICSALATLARVSGPAALGDLLAALESDALDVRAAALAATARFTDPAVTDQLATKAAALPADRRAQVIDAIGARRDPRAVAILLASVKDSEKSVRIAAARRLAQLATPEASAALISALGAGDADESRAFQEAIARIPGDRVLTDVAAALDVSSPAKRVRLMQVLAARRARSHMDKVIAATKDESVDVRIAAIRAVGEIGGADSAPRLLDLLLAANDPRTQSEAQTALIQASRKIAQPDQRTAPVIAALAQAPDAKRTALFRVLSQFGGEPAMKAVAQYVQTPALADAAVRALADWPDASAEPQLLQVAKETKSEPHHVLALRGYIRLVGLESARAPEQSAQRYQQAIAAARRPDEKRQAIAGLAGVRHLTALNAVAGYLDDPALADDAAFAAVRIALGKDKNDKPLAGPQVLEVMKKVAETAKDAAVRDRSAAYVAAQAK